MTSSSFSGKRCSSPPVTRTTGGSFAARASLLAAAKTASRSASSATDRFTRTTFFAASVAASRVRPSRSSGVTPSAAITFRRPLDSSVAGALPPFCSAWAAAAGAPLASTRSIAPVVRAGARGAGAVATRALGASCVCMQ
jgi:hypothetical protein